MKQKKDKGENEGAQKETKKKRSRVKKIELTLRRRTFHLI